MYELGFELSVLRVCVELYRTLSYPWGLYI
jgi:hypothetical protein